MTFLHRGLHYSFIIHKAKFFHRVELMTIVIISQETFSDSTTVCFRMTTQSKLLKELKMGELKFSVFFS